MRIRRHLAWHPNSGNFCWASWATIPLAPNP
jgi:hypothetical protein